MRIQILFGIRTWWGIGKQGRKLINFMRSPLDNLLFSMMAYKLLAESNKQDTVLLCRFLKVYEQSYNQILVVCYENSLYNFMKDYSQSK